MICGARYRHLDRSIAFCAIDHVHSPLYPMHIALTVDGTAVNVTWKDSDPYAMPTLEPIDHERMVKLLRGTM